MKLNNNDIINYGTPVSSSFGRRHRRFAALRFNDRSPEVSALHAHLRASAYAEKGHTCSSVDIFDRHNPAAVTGTGVSANLLREYDNEVSANFLREAMLFGVIAVIGLVVPIVHLIQTLPQ
jgi:hypothetical protein